MQVLIPHPTELISLTALQKKLIKDNFSPDCLLTRFIPLWIDLPLNKTDSSEFSKTELKILIKSLKKIELSAPEVDSSSTSIYCPAEISFSDYKVSTKLNLIKIHNPKAFTLKKISTEEINFPLCLKIFRIGNKIELPEQNAHAIQDFVWKKL